ncbi:MAG: cation transporter [Candidatus Thorarchaeota archaeon]|nr:cation transporter [Candidatus Thorarchaeota archaeon]
MIDDNTKTGNLESLFQFSENEIHHSRDLRENAEILHGDPAETLLYAILCAIYDGFNTRSKLYRHLDSMFAFRLDRMAISPVDRDESIQQGLNENLIDSSNGELILTKEGIRILRLSRIQVLHEGVWARRFLSERIVVTVSALTLIFLVLAKIWIGTMVSSGAMITDGLENLTDLGVVVIIAYSLQTGRDRLGALAIMSFMLISGCLLGYNAILRLLAPDTIEVNYWAYIVTVMSVALNYLLIWYKATVGRMTGNLSLISDAKEDGTHIRIGAGVLIGLVFAEFGVYIVDSLVALFIALVIVWEGIEALRELLEAGDDFSVDTIHLAASLRYDDRITNWALVQLARGPRNLIELNDSFLRGVKIGLRYFDIHAIIGYGNLEEKGIAKHIQIARRSGLIKGNDDELMITNNGLRLYYNNRASELKKVAKRYSKMYSRSSKTAIGILSWIFFFALMAFGEMIYTIFFDFARYVVGIILQGLAG